MSDKPALPKGFKVNPGRCPKEAAGKRVLVILRYSMAEPKYANETRPDLSPGWAADERGACRWTLRNDPFDIIGYRVL